MNDITKLRGELKTARKDLVRIETKKKYLPSNTELDEELNAAVERCAEIEALIAEAQEEATAELKRKQEEASERRKQELEEKSQGYRFDIPDDDPVITCQLYAAMNERLQYQFASTQGAYEALQAKVMGRKYGEDTGATPEDSSNPEITRGDADKLDAIVEQREYLLTLRMALKAHFIEMEENIPVESNYRPVFQRRSDNQVFASIQERRDKQFIEQRELQKKAREQFSDWTRATDLNLI